MWQWQRKLSKFKADLRDLETDRLVLIPKYFQILTRALCDTSACEPEHQDN